MIAFDSNVLIYIIERNPRFFSKAERIFLDIETQGGVCSTLVVTESLYENIQSVAQLFPLHSPMILIAPLDTKIAETAGRLRIKYGLKAPDSIHVATAVEKGAEVLITNDQRMLKIKVPGLEIKQL